MDRFSLFNYAHFSDSLKVIFNKDLALGLQSMMEEIEKDNDLNFSLVNEFITSSGKDLSFALFVEDLYSQISSRIQAGSGNQTLSLGILAKYNDCWNRINR